jgi:hypothetical protein
MTSTLRPRSIQGDQITVQEVETETLLYDERTHKAWCLNRSSACIWRLCDGTRTASQIAQTASQEMDCAVSEDLVLLALAELREKALLEELNASLMPEGISRRRMIGRAGLAAASLLPVVAAITAPTALALNGSGGTGSGSEDTRPDPSGSDDQ